MNSQPSITPNSTDFNIPILGSVLGSLINLAVGLIAWFVYEKQKRDNKKDAANIILLEIKNGERVLKLGKENLSRTDELPENLFSMRTESWSKYKYLFVRDFDRDEWDTVSEFYDKCRLYDEAVMYNNSFFQKNEEQIRVNVQRVFADYAKEYAEKNESPENLEEFNEKRKRFQAKYMDVQNIYLYNPKKPVTDAKSYLEGLNLNISLTTIGTKLKKIAKLKD